MRQEFRLSQIYQEGLLRLLEKDYEKARELLESVLKDHLLPNGQVIIVSENFMLHNATYLLHLVS